MVRATLLLGALWLATAAPVRAAITVGVRDHDFIPRKITVRAGTLVIWKSLDLYVPHSISSGRLSDDHRWKRGLLYGPGQTFEHRFARPGR